MTDPWFTPEAAQWFSLLGVLSLTAVAAPFIARGTRQKLVLGVWGAVTVFGLAMLMLGIAAHFEQQPFYVTIPLLVAGGATAAAYGVTFYFVWRAYRVAERRRIAAHEL